MIVNKITQGEVIQEFDERTGELKRQYFVASDQVEYQDEEGNEIPFQEEYETLYYPFKMEQMFGPGS